MSQWAPDSTTAVKAQGTPPSPQSGDGGISQTSKTPAFLPWWVRVVPFFLSAFFFLSAIFSIFSPLPLLFSRLRLGRTWALVAIVTNSVIVGLAAGSPSLAVYLTFVVSFVLILPELLLRQVKLERAVVLSLCTMAFTAFLLLGGYCWFHHLNPVSTLKSEISGMIDFLAQSMTAANSGSAGTNSLMSIGDPEEWKQSFLREFPSAVAVFALVLVWANIVMLLRVNPLGIREKLGLDPAFLRRWKAPEWLVWPTIVTGAFLVLDVGRVSVVSLNVFKFLMAIYAIQGLSILSFFLDVWHVRGIFRGLIFVITLILMMPLLLSLGFFDLWFDFRAKFRQS